MSVKSKSNSNEFKAKVVVKVLENSKVWKCLSVKLFYNKQGKRKIAEYICFYNYKRPHASVDYKTPMSVYMAGLEKVSQMGNKKIKKIDLAKGYRLIRFFCFIFPLKLLEL